MTEVVAEVSVNDVDISVEVGSNVEAISAQTDIVIHDGGSATLQTKTKSYTPTETAQSEDITPDSGYDGLEKVEVSVGAIPDDYVGSSIDRNDSDDMTVNGATVTAPAGYYAEASSKQVASGSVSTPETTITANPTISVSSSGLITASVSGSQSIAPSVSAGYVSSGTAGTVSVSGSATSQLPLYDGS